MTEELPELYTIESLEQLHVISDDLRVRILQLSHTPHTVTQIADVFKMVPAKVHYHVRELERIKLIALVEIREKGGILEKYYQSVAKNFTVSHTLFSSPNADEVFSLILHSWKHNYDGLVRSLRVIIQDGEQSDTVGEYSSNQLWISKDEYRALRGEIQKLMAPYLTFRWGPDVRERTMVTIAYDAYSEPDIIQETEIPADLSADARIRTILVGGITQFSRTDLEEATAQNEQFAITVYGICRFAADVTPELIDRAVVSFKCHGVLDASDAVRAQLKQK